MGGRGRGRGGRGGAKQSFSREQLSSMGISGNEVLPGPVTQPPMLFPMLARKPVPLTVMYINYMLVQTVTKSYHCMLIMVFMILQPSLESDYLLMLKQDIIDHMNLSSAYLKMNKAKENHAEQEIDKLLSQLPKTTKEVFDWNFFPSELRPKLSAKRFLKRNIKKEVDVNSRYINYLMECLIFFVFFKLFILG